MMGQTKLRLFFALWPDESVRNKLAEPVRLLKPVLSARWTRPENLHLTLAFLGDVDAGRLVEAKVAGDAINAQSFELLLDRIEHWRKPQVICLSASAIPESLDSLAASLAIHLRDADFKLDKRPFRAHLTLARKALYLPASIGLEHPIRWPASSFALVESGQEKHGSNYTILQSWPLK